VLNTIILDAYLPNYYVCQQVWDYLRDWIDNVDTWTFVTHEVSNAVTGSSEGGNLGLKKSLFQEENAFTLRETFFHEGAHLLGYVHGSQEMEYAEECGL
jgi:hypothetical protein